MRWFYLSLFLLVLSLAPIIPARWPAAAQNKQLSNFELQILAEHNNVRQKNNVSPLAWDDTLAALAQEWASKIAADGAIPPPHRQSGKNLFWGTADAWSPKDILGLWEAESTNFTVQTC